MPFICFVMLRIHFISHLVQIKRERYRLKHFHFKHLYIPLSSDKTETTRLLPVVRSIFISHLVQIKRVKPLIPDNKSCFFISHLVQIKPRCQILVVVQVELYIPLSSDKTWNLLPLRQVNYSLYPT